MVEEPTVKDEPVTEGALTKIDEEEQKSVDLSVEEEKAKEKEGEPAKIKMVKVNFQD